MATVAEVGLCFSCLLLGTHCLIIRLRAHRRCLCQRRGKIKRHFCSKKCELCCVFTRRQQPLPHLTTLDLHPMVVVGGAGGGCVLAGGLFSSPVLIEPSDESTWQGERAPPPPSWMSWNLFQNLPKVPTPYGCLFNTPCGRHGCHGNVNGGGRESRVWKRAPDLLHQCG